MIIDLAQERLKRDTPISIKSEDGQTYSLFTAGYRLDDGRLFSVAFYGLDTVDAERHVQAMRDGLELEGELHAIIHDTVGR